MLIWLCALHCEAKPVIDFYRLKKHADTHAFDLYQSENMACVVSGIGDLNMAAACAWAAARFEKHKPCWINLGVAGHQSLPLSTVVLANQVYRQGQPQAIYPVPLIPHPWQSLSLISQAQEQTEYHPSAAFDMEGYAFLHSCSRFTPLELCSCIKLISDNAEHPPQRDKARISQWIADQMQHIADFATRLQQMADDYYAPSLPDELLERFLQLSHFTRSQQIQLAKILTALRSFEPSLDEYFQLCRQQVDSKQMLSVLQQRLNQQCEVLSW
jgi:adenosylhomocysteine nucleosidase